jgi:hypothetical protein
MRNHIVRLNAMAVFPLVSLVLVTAGCAHIRSSPTRCDGKLEGDSPIGVELREVKFMGELLVARGNGQFFQDQFMRHFSQLMPIEEGAALTLENVTIDLQFEEPQGNDVAIQILSTVFVPLCFKGRVRDATSTVTYSLRDGSNSEVVSALLRRDISGSYRGWSFFRRVSAARLENQERVFAAQDAARMVAADLYSKAGARQIQKMTADPSKTMPSHSKGWEPQSRGGSLPTPIKSDVSNPEIAPYRSPQSARGITVEGGQAVPQDTDRKAGNPRLPDREDISGRLRKLKELRDSGDITDEEYQSGRKAVLGQL